MNHNNAKRDAPSALRAPTAPEMVQVGDVAEILYQCAYLLTTLKSNEAWGAHVAQ